MKNFDPSIFFMILFAAIALIFMVYSSPSDICKVTWTENGKTYEKREECPEQN